MDKTQQALTWALCWSGTRCAEGGCSPCPYDRRAEVLRRELRGLGYDVTPIHATLSAVETAGEKE